MAAPTVTGTVSSLDASGGNGNGNVTVPGDANIVVAFWSHWDGNGGSTLATLTLNGVSFMPAKAQLAEGAATDETGGGVALLVNPATGTQNVAWTWSAGGARSEGGRIMLVYVTGGNTADPFRDADANATTGTTDLGITIDTNSTDLVLAMASSFNTPGNPDITSGTVVMAQAATNSHEFVIESLTPGASSLAIAMTGEYYSLLTGISLKEDAGGGGGGTLSVNLAGRGGLAGAGGLAGVGGGLVAAPSMQFREAA